MAYTAERPLDPLTLDVYPGDGAFTLYEDDGSTFAYEQGQFCTTTYQVHHDGGQLVLTIGQREGGYVPSTRQIVVRVHAVAAQTVPDDPAATYDSVRRILTLTFDDDSSARMLRLQG